MRVRLLRIFGNRAKGNQEILTLRAIWSIIVTGMNFNYVNKQLSALESNLFSAHETLYVRI